MNIPDPLTYMLRDNGIFPNSRLPVIHYKKALDISFFFPGNNTRKLFEQNGWSNSWCAGIFTYHHYHSITHEVLGIIKGNTVLQLGGENGKQIDVHKGDVLIIPAGVAHKNLGKENDVSCIGSYPNGMDYDMNYGHPSERPKTDEQIAAVPIPSTDPLLGEAQGLCLIWR